MNTLSDFMVRTAPEVWPGVEWSTHSDPEGFFWIVGRANGQWAQRSILMRATGMLTVQSLADLMSRSCQEIVDEIAPAPPTFIDWTLVGCG